MSYFCQTGERSDPSFLERIPPKKFADFSTCELITYLHQLDRPWIMTFDSSKPIYLIFCRQNIRTIID
ncbi:MAG: hypothetical protein HC916_14610 [Coleofasciculaceae cyanobacterium SM2_1_6]|nr:hypothetical protein [Coleofasciculaceae cyanobacterium SM2_1_6]